MLFTSLVGLRNSSAGSRESAQPDQPGKQNPRQQVRRNGLTSHSRIGVERLEERSLMSVAPLDFVDRFVDDASGGLARPRGLTFGPDGNGDGVQDLYVASADTDEVLRYSGVNGEFIDAFVTAASGGLDSPCHAVFGPDGNFYVSGYLSNQVVRYNGSGNFLDVVASGLGGPCGLTFGSDGSLYISNQDTDDVLRYNSTTGLTPFVTAGSGGLDFARQAVFGPDGNLYVASLYTSTVLRYNGSTGAFIDEFVTPFTYNLWWIEFGTDGYLYTSGATSEVSVNCCDSSFVRFDAVTGAFVDRFNLRRHGAWFVLKTDPVDGVVVYNAAPNAVTEGYPFGDFVERFVSSPTPDQTKFYVVNDASQGRTYEYGETGSAFDNYELDSGNTNPRGAAIEGFTTLVVDANKNVYVYNTDGTLLGSWTAGGLNAQAQLEGIAAHRDVWLVDNKQDRVYRYTWASWRLSGSQNAFSSFSLNSGNRNPKDIVTDGQYLWVLNDSGSDKVFKYTLAGSLVGSWSISTPSANSPTGITLDRGNPDHLWIVDSGTDRVYQYDGATTRTSGSQSASTSFALAAGNTNPQGIADPPVSAAVTEGVRVQALDDYLSTQVNEENEHRSVTIADRFVDTLFHLGNKRGRIRSLNASR